MIRWIDQAIIANYSAIVKFRLHYRAGEASGLVGVRQLVWRQCDRRKKLHFFTGLET
ncbi:hypothetical protein [Nostoc sp.]